MAVSKKERRSRTFISPRVRSDPLWLLGSDVTGDQSEGSELMFCIRTFPLLGDRCMTVRSVSLMVRPSPSPTHGGDSVKGWLIL